MKTIELETCNHLGDTICLTAVMKNASLAMPDVRFTYRGNYGAVFKHSEWQANTEYSPDECYTVKYRDNHASDSCAQNGTLVEGMTAALAFHLGKAIPAVRKTPKVRLSEQELAWAENHPACGAVIVNTNCQQCSTTKAYPWWNNVIRRLDLPVAVIGGAEKRDVRETINTKDKRVMDLRGKTTIRQLLALVAKAKMVISPSSAVIHAAAAFGIPSITITGAREPVKLTGYPNNIHMTSVCVGRKIYDMTLGCMHFRTQDFLSCEKPVKIVDKNYAACMACISPETIVDKAKEIMQKNTRRKK